MIETLAPDRLKVANAYRALYLLPGAPRELIEAAYEMLARDGAALHVRAAYETIVATLEPLRVEQFPRRLSPWHLLHLQPNAPQPLFAAAYHIWLGGAEPREIHPAQEGTRGPNVTVETTFRSPLPTEVDKTESTEAEPFVFASEELFDGVPDVSDIQEVREAADAPEAYIFAFEEFALEQDGRDDLKVAATEADGAKLVGPDGCQRAVTDRPLRIGTQPSCEVFVRAGGRFEARVWRNKSRVLVHAIGDRGAVLVNGQDVTWAVLTDGDTLAVGPAAFTFQSR